MPLHRLILALRISILSLAALGVLASGVLGCSGPFAVFPGGALEGPVKPMPADFELARGAGTIQLETRPTDPYSVNIACAVVDGRLYVSAGGNKSTWVENMEANPLVRVRIEGDIYDFRAQRVTDDAEIDAFAEEWTKNSWARDPTTLDEVWIYRMEAR